MRVATLAVAALACAGAAHAASMTPEMAGEVTRAFEALVADESVGKPPVVHTEAPLDNVVVDGAETITPVVLMHGLGDSGSNPGMQSLAKSIMTKYPGSYATAVDVADGMSSIFQKIQPQVDQFAKVVKADPKLANGFNVVGLSQGGIIIRAYVEQYNDPPVKRFVAICGVVNGVFDCPAEVKIIPFLCDLFKSNPYRFLFNGSFELSFSDYFVGIDNKTKFLEESEFLPALNGQVPSPHIASYKSNWASLERITLIEATKDTMVYPYQAEQFGGYKWASKNELYLYNDTSNDMYQNDYFGLKTTDKAGKISLMSYVGDHLRFSNQFWNEQVLPLFA